MNLNIEKEYKILVNEQQFKQLLSMYNNYEIINQSNTYYDTEDGQINKLKAGCRIRLLDGKYIFTLKIHSSIGNFEYVKEVNEDSEEVFNDHEIKALLRDHGIYGKFIKTSAQRTRRYLVKLAHAELCFDENYFKTANDYEIEYEYLDEHDGRKIFNDILSNIGLVYESNCISKLQRSRLYWK